MRKVKVAATQMSCSWNREAGSEGSSRRSKYYLVTGIV